MEDELLNQLAREAQQLTEAARQDPSRNLERQRVLNRLLTHIMRSKRLAHPQQGQWEPLLYEDLWNQALSQTMLEIARRIADYDPNYAILAWVNKILSYRFKDVVRDYYTGGITGVPRQTDSPEIGKVLSLDQLQNVSGIRTLDDLESDQANHSTNFELLHQFILDDPEQKFADSIRGRPIATFRFLLLARLEGQSWEEIADHLGPPPLSKQTLSSFFNRRLRQLEAYFQKYLSE